jgi:hypothetical protein
MEWSNGFVNNGSRCSHFPASAGAALPFVKLGHYGVQVAGTLRVPWQATAHGACLLP